MQRSSAALLVLTLALAAGVLVALVEQKPAGPANNDGAQLIAITIEGSSRAEACKLAITTYDLSLAGFANGAGRWFAFPGPTSYLLPTATPLPFGSSYRDLIGGIRNLPDVPLGRDPMARAAAALSGYDPTNTASDETIIKRALAALKVMTCEAQRLPVIKETVTKAWESGDGRVAREHLPYVEHWDTICYEIIRAEKNGGVWDGPFTNLLREHANIHGMDDALGVVGVITNRTMEQILMAHARSA